MFAFRGRWIGLSAGETVATPVGIRAGSGLAGGTDAPPGAKGGSGIMSTTLPPTRTELRIGDTASFAKQITDRDVFEFAFASGDFNPLHIDDEYARRTVFGRRIAHGILTAGVISSVLGRELPGVGTIFLELCIRFVKPVYLGDTITARATVSEFINPKRVRLVVSCINQDGCDVAVGSAIVVPPKNTRLIDGNGRL
jgi:3-hydroxybutyryl-CoA dehydratase